MSPQSCRTGQLRPVLSRLASLRQVAAVAQRSDTHCIGHFVLELPHVNKVALRVLERRVASVDTASAMTGSAADRRTAISP